DRVQQVVAGPQVPVVREVNGGLGGRGGVARHVQRGQEGAPIEPRGRRLRIGGRRQRALLTADESQLGGEAIDVGPEVVDELAQLGDGRLELGELLLGGRGHRPSGLLDRGARGRAPQRVGIVLGPLLYCTRGVLGGREQ